jgi:alkylation response protein AidB-like acyl-CoA dehydrogenase
LINGEKLWTSFAQHATRCVVLARTGEPGSRGISAFLVDMDTPGVTASPLRTMADVDEFCSTSFIDVQVPAHRLLGEINGGWQIAQYILSCEPSPCSKVSAQLASVRSSNRPAAPGGVGQDVQHSPSGP